MIGKKKETSVAKEIPKSTFADSSKNSIKIFVPPRRLKHKMVAVVIFWKKCLLVSHVYDQAKVGKAKGKSEGRVATAQPVRAGQEGGGE